MVLTCGTPQINNILLPVAHTEHVISVPGHTKKIMLQARKFVELKVAFAAGQSGTKFFTIRSGGCYFEDNVHGPFIMAIQSEEDNTIIEYVTWNQWD